ncbi:MAG: calcium-translocating P-type ATPase, PMCA-type [Bacillota bacterium]|nr:calcium-translocating P-type ATPase, PMCA-type [Bacillota bacterium]
MNLHMLGVKEAAKSLDSSEKSGLTQIEAARRLNLHGKNLLKAKKKKGILQKFIAQFSDFMIIVLLISAAISFAMSYISGDSDILDPIIILAIVVVNACLGVFQEQRAEAAIEKLKSLSSPKAVCIREGKRITVPSELLTVGDLIELRAGDMIPADCRLTEAVHLTVSEAALTGESMQTEKSAKAVVGEYTLLPDRINCVFGSTLVTGGRGKGLIYAVGMETQVGQVARLLDEEPEESTPLQKRLAKAGKSLAMAAIFACVIVFFTGLLRHYSPFFMFMTSVSLAVAAIPEGLPAIVTVMLALGVGRMAKKKAVVRHLTAVEALGSATVICSDKTGTLTQNSMKVTELSGHPEALKWMCVCSDATETSGTPTEIAVIKKGEAEGIKKEELDKMYSRIDEIPFDSDRKRMTVLVTEGKNYITITKGAFDPIIELCSDIAFTSGEAKMTVADRRRLEAVCASMAKKGLRVLAAAYKKGNRKELSEKDMTFLGLVAMADPLRPESKEAVRLCKKAGIEVIMITGDHKDTALSIARELGIAKEGDRAITGLDLTNMNDEELKEALKKARVFARVLPEHKVRIVKALKSSGHIVAMTGDGVNDAPALKAADIGCAMGKSGTDVAREASDMVLTDDNFATIVGAIKEGRGIYDNIRKAIHFLLSSNIGEILVMLTGILTGMGMPLLPIQLLWVNLITDSLPAIALGLDKSHDSIMEKPPKKPGDGFFSGGLWYDILLEGALIGAISLAAFSAGINRVGGSVAAARTMAFCTLSISQLVHAFDVRSKKSVFTLKDANLWLLGACFIGTLLQLAVVIIPVLNTVFKTVPLESSEWVTVGFLCFVPLFVTETEKALRKLSNN